MYNSEKIYVISASSSWWDYDDIKEFLITIVSFKDKEKANAEVARLKTLIEPIIQALKEKKSSMYSTFGRDNVNFTLEGKEYFAYDFELEFTIEEVDLVV